MDGIFLNVGVMNTMLPQTNPMSQIRTAYMTAFAIRYGIAMTSRSDVRPVNCLTPAFQQRRLMMAPAVGCKRLLDRVSRLLSFTPLPTNTFPFWRRLPSRGSSRT